MQFPNAIYYGPAVGDLNGDGRPDIVIGDRNGRLNVFLNNCGAAPANLGVTVSESADPVNEGDELTYTVTVTNHTDSVATGVQLTSVLSPVGLGRSQEPNVVVLATTSSAGGTLTTAATNTFTWTLPTLAANSTATFEFRLGRSVAQTLVFTTGVTSDGAETDPSDNAATATTTVIAVGRTIGGHEHERQRAGLAAAGDPRVQRPRRRGHDCVQHPARRTADDHAAQSAAGDHAAGDHRRHDPAGIQRRADRRAERQRAAGQRARSSPAATRRFEAWSSTGSVEDGIFDRRNGGNVDRGELHRHRRHGDVGPAQFAGRPPRAPANNRIGGTAPAARNVISGNNGDGVAIDVDKHNNIIQGNHIGTNAAGTAAVPNTNAGIRIFSGDNTVGGSAAGARNLISGNGNGGISFANTASGNIVEGNFIGTNVGGTAALGNGNFVGVVVNGPGNRIGGPAAEQRNVISGHGTRNGIQIAAATAVNNVVQGNYIGTDVTGTLRLPNQIGIQVTNSATGTLIGGTAAGVGNVVSGNNSDGISISNNATGTRLEGNLIGTNAAGTAAVTNTLAGVRVAAANAVIGGTAPGARNIISGNTSTGVVLGTGSTGTVVQGNYIGTNVSGTAAMPNMQHGVSATSASAVTVGGTQAGAGNVDLWEHPQRHQRVPEASVS